MPTRTKLSKTQGAIAAMVIGGVFFLYASYTISLACASLAWPTTKGVVTSSRIERQGAGRARNRRRSAVVRYEYYAGGRKHKGSRYRFGGTHTSVFYSIAKIKHPINRKYPKGASVTVRYNPKRPREATISSGVAFWVFPFLILGALAFTAGVCDLLGKKSFLKTKKKNGKRHKNKRYKNQRKEDHGWETDKGLGKFGSRKYSS